MRQALFALISLSFLAACSDSTESLKQLRHAQPNNDAYQSALAARYQEYSEERVASYDWWVSKYFADKGLMAAQGREVLPEDPQHWKNIPAAKRPELTEARTNLLALLPTTKQNKPAESAQAVVAYDRWIEAQDRRWDAERITAASDQYFAALKLLGAPPAAPISAIPTGELPAPIETSSTILYFPFDSANLTETAHTAVEELAAYLTSAGKAKININGHADRAGTEEYNMSLSEERARLVMEALVDAGIAQDAIDYFAFGETDNAVATEDGVREPLNRRVEIFLE